MKLRESVQGHINRSLHLQTSHNKNSDTSNEVFFESKQSVINTQNALNELNEVVNKTIKSDETLEQIS